MFSARTGKVLGFLLVAMTIGALLLMFLESDPPRPSENDLAAVRRAVVNGPQQIAQPWRRIVVHSSVGSQDTLPGRCHFIVHAAPDSQGHWVEATDLWKTQTSGRHIDVPDSDYSADSIGICLMGDFSTRPPSREQFQALMTLIRELQRRCNIGADSVVLRRQLRGQPALPGKAFPAGTFNKGLYRPVE